MTIENQVCSLELATKIHKLGITTPSIFYSDSSKSKNSEIEMWGKPDYCPDNINRYTVAELGEMLIPHVFLEMTNNLEKGITLVASGKEKHHEYATTEADARAKMLVYLLENKLIKL